MKYSYYTNKDLTEGIHKLARAVTIDDFKPQLIVGVLRGGIIPAVYLSHWFGCSLASTSWTTRDDAVVNNETIDDEVYEAIASNKHVLLIDDICDSGLTLKQIFENIKEKTELHRNLKSAVLHYNIGQDAFEPDYYHLEINNEDDPSWVVYPWEDV